MINEPYRIRVPRENTHEPLFTAACRTWGQDRVSGPLGRSTGYDFVGAGFVAGLRRATDPGGIWGGGRRDGVNAVRVARLRGGGYVGGPDAKRYRGGPRLCPGMVARCRAKENRPQVSKGAAL